MIIELLKVKVPPEQREKYIQKDAEIWTAALAKHPGFLGKEVWSNPKDATEVVLVIHWATKEHWKAIPQVELEAIEQKFSEAMGKSYPIVESSEYQVRKFPQKEAG
ncbi:TIGR03792 family protein [Mastigocladopsis repens]|uniref:TIGR03792 family protein n=1 Tax=Mastigocladopsis repens TaxID=221287 RepID=UPI0002FB2DA8|nr:TIGR03792 family protein [Mastigocladopsis repens]